MSFKSALTSALYLFVVFAFIFGGAFFSFLPYSPLRLEFVEKSPLLGMGLFLVGLFLLLSFYLIERGKYLVLKMGVIADVNVIRQSIDTCFARQFPEKIHLVDVEIARKKRLDIKVNFATLDKQAKKQLLSEVEKELNTLLRDRFGYTKSFNLIVLSKR